MMTVFVQYAPYDLDSGAGERSGENWTEAQRKAFADCVFDKIEQGAPDFRKHVLHAEVRSPYELENEVGLTEGNIFQGELTFDQLLFNRPVPGYAQTAPPSAGSIWSARRPTPAAGLGALAPTPRNPAQLGKAHAMPVYAE